MQVRRSIALLYAVLLVAVVFASGARASEDYSTETWVGAFARLNAHLAKTYPYTNWKAIDWNIKYARFAPRIAAAQRRHDFDAYYMAVREYIYSIPDSHVRFIPTINDALLRRDAGGYYGFDAALDDNGRIIVAGVYGAAARRLGIRVGDEISRWNGYAARAALFSTPILWARNPAATIEDLRREQLRFFVRGPISLHTAIRVVSPTGSSKDITLQTYDDKLESLTRTDWRPSAADQAEAINAKMLDGHVAYVRISALTGLTGASSRAITQRVGAAVESFMSRGAKSLILDVRRNPGGGDDVAAAVVSFFSRVDPVLYDQVEIPDEGGAYQIDKTSVFYTTKPAHRFLVPTVVLISTGTKSAAEGLANFLKGQHGITLMGRTATAGAYGDVEDGGIVRMPGGFAVNATIGRGVDVGRNIIIESNAQMLGGVAPDIRIPVTRESLIRADKCKCDVDLNYALRYLNNMPPTAQLQVNGFPVSRKRPLRHNGRRNPPLEDRHTNVPGQVQVNPKR